MAQILIIDDDKMLCEMVCKKLRRLEHYVESSNSLAQGFEMIGGREFDLVLLDVRLPDGAELALESGAWDYILKPLSLRYS